MQVMFDKIPIDNCWSSRPSTRVINRATVISCHALHTHDQSCVAWRCVSGLVFVIDDIAEMLKMQHILLIMDFPCGSTTP